MARQFIVSGAPFPVYLNETETARQYMSPAVYLHEPAAPDPPWPPESDFAQPEMYVTRGTQRF